MSQKTFLEYPKAQPSRTTTILDVTCALEEIFKGLRTIYKTAYARRHCCCFLAEQEILWLFASSWDTSILYPIAACVRQTGCVVVPMRLVTQFLQSHEMTLKKGGGATACSTSMQISVTESRTRRRSKGAPLRTEHKGTIQMKWKGYGREHCYPLSFTLEPHEELMRHCQHLLETIVLPADIRSTMILHASMFRALSKYVVFAAKPMPISLSQPPPLPWYNVRYQFSHHHASCYLTCLAGDETHTAICSQHSYLPPARTKAGETFVGEISLPAHLVREIVSLRPLQHCSQIQLQRTPQGALVRVGPAIFHVANCPTPPLPEIPDSRTMSIRVVVSAMQLKRVLRVLEKNLASRSEPRYRDQWLVSLRLVHDALVLTPITEKGTYLACQKALPILSSEGSKPDAMALLPLRGAINMLQNLSGSVAICAYAQPSHSLFVMSALVQPYRYTFWHPAHGKKGIKSALDEPVVFMEVRDL